MYNHRMFHQKNELNIYESLENKVAKILNLPKEQCKVYEPYSNDEGHFHYLEIEGADEVTLNQYAEKLKKAGIGINEVRFSCQFGEFVINLTQSYLEHRPL